MHDNRFLFRLIMAGGRSRLPILIAIATVVLAGCPLEPPSFDNPVDPRNQQESPDQSDPDPETDLDPESDPDPEPEPDPDPDPEPLFAIGDTGPAGGIVFFVDDADAYPDWDYLEVAPNDPGSLLWDEGGLPFTFIDDTATQVGTGQENTTAITSALGAGTYAARVAQDYTEGGFSDWFLPSLDELQLVYDNLDAIGDLNADYGFASTYYWSSSEIDADNVWAVNFFNGDPLDRGKDMGNFPFRPIRRF